MESCSSMTVTAGGVERFFISMPEAAAFLGVGFLGRCGLFPVLVALAGVGLSGR